MASFNKSFVIITKQEVGSFILEANDKQSSQLSAGNPSAELLSDVKTIEEITITVRDSIRHSKSGLEDQKILATLDPMSQVLWLQALRHLH